MHENGMEMQRNQMSSNGMNMVHKIISVSINNLPQTYNIDETKEEDDDDTNIIMTLKLENQVQNW